MASKLVLTSILVLTFFLHINCQQHLKNFRKDYKYLEVPQSFYKIHTIHKTWLEAKRICSLEGASLFYPQDTTEANEVLKYWNQTQPFQWVYIGVSSLMSKGVFETIDGIPVSEVYNTWSPGEPNDSNGNENCVVLRNDGTLNDDRCDKKNPFICKKTLVSLEWNTHCNMPYKEYTYNEKFGKCYKFHLSPMNWTEAYFVCSAEQSYLTVINSQEEANYLVQMTEQAPKEKITGNYLRGAVLIGFHDQFDEGWKTIKGTTLANSGYSVWGNMQPDGSGREKCGSMFYNGHLNDIGCHHKCFFICEHDIDMLNSLIDFRISQYY